MDRPNALINSIKTFKYPSHEDTLDRSMNILTLVPFDGFVPIMTEIIKGVYRDTGDKKICYISLNKPVKAMLATFHGEGLNIERFHIIDAVTKMAIPTPKPVENTTYVSSPAALGEIYSAFSQLVDQEDFGAVILDSISTILVYEQPSVAIKFLHVLITKATVKGCHGAFICLKEDMNAQLLRELNMIVDVVRDYAKDMPIQETGVPQPQQPSQPAQPSQSQQPPPEEKKPGFLKRLFGKKKKKKEEIPPPPEPEPKQPEYQLPSEKRKTQQQNA